MLGCDMVALGIFEDSGEVRLAVAFAWMLFFAEVRC
jgi:hypothetical protein